MIVNNKLADISLFLTKIPIHEARMALIIPTIIKGVNPPAKASVQERDAATFSHTVPSVNVISMPIIFAIKAFLIVKDVFRETIQ